MIFLQWIISKIINILLLSVVIISPYLLETDGFCQELKSNSRVLLDTNLEISQKFTLAKRNDVITQEIQRYDLDKHNDLITTHQGKRKHYKKRKIKWYKKGEILTRIYRDITENEPLEDIFSAHSWVTLEGKAVMPENGLSMVVSTRFQFDMDTDSEVDDDVDLFLKEAYLRFKKNRFEFRLGRRYINWGRLDEIYILDLVNPQDYTEGILLYKKERKLPVFLIETKYLSEVFSLEGFLIPWFKPNKISFFDTDWSIFRYLKRDILTGGYSQNIKRIIRQIRLEDDDKEHTLENIETGLRFTLRSKRADYGFYYLYIFDRVPVLKEKTPGGNTLKSFLYSPTAENLLNLIASNPGVSDLTLIEEYNRLNILGMDFESFIGQFGVRGEIGFLFSNSYLKDDFSVIKKDTVSFGIGIDHTTPNDFYYNLQLIGRYIFEYEELYQTKRLSHQIIGIFSKDFWRGRLTPSLYCGYSLTYKDSFFNPEIRYNFDRGLSMAIGGFIFDGDLQTTFGLFDDNDSIYVRTEYKF